MYSNLGLKGFQLGIVEQHVFRKPAIFRLVEFRLDLSLKQEDFERRLYLRRRGSAKNGDAASQTRLAFQKKLLQKFPLPQDRRNIQRRIQAPEQL